MSGGLRTSVKSDIIAKRVTGTLEINTVHEDETSINVTSMASASYGPNICDGNIPCLPMLSSAAKSTETTTRAKGQPHAEIDIGLQKRVTLKQLKEATRNFSKRYEIGQGGFGTVYKAELQGKIVAVKRLSFHSEERINQLKNEFYTLKLMSHENLVELLDVYNAKGLHLLIYEYIQNNSLAHTLFDSKSKLKLDWEARFNICLGIARGLVYLHEHPSLKMVHRGIKSANILLDRDLKAKISDLGLACLYTEDDDDQFKFIKVEMPRGYMPPEYIRGIVTSKADVYSFGVVILEIVSGRKNAGHKRGSQEIEFLLDRAYDLHQKGRLVDLVDKSLCTKYDAKQAIIILNLAIMCTMNSPTLRPTMSQVVSVLVDAKNIEEICPLLEDCSNDSRIAEVDFSASIEVTSRASTSSKSMVTTTRSESLPHAAGAIASSRHKLRSPLFVHGTDIDIGLEKGVTLKQLKKATRKFSKRNMIGQGGFWTAYKADLQGKIVAVKRLSSHSEESINQLKNEFYTLKSMSHQNLIQLLDVYNAKHLHLLIYEYMENNSLADALFDSKFKLKLDWEARFNICLGIARGLVYLHEHPRLKMVHRDIKSANILLDRDLKAKISDFGLASLYTEDDQFKFIKIEMSQGYMSPEYVRGIVTSKADVYSFGVVVLETISGRRNVGHNGYNQESEFLLDMAYDLHRKGRLMDLVDKNLPNYDAKEAITILNLAVKCTSISPTVRPTMSEVVSVLVGDKTIEEICPPLRDYSS